jgi:hypothetical protein
MSVPQPATTVIPTLSIQHVYTRDVKIPEFDERRRDCGWISLAMPPDSSGRWQIFDFSFERRTGWRLITLVE